MPDTLLPVCRHRGGEAQAGAYRCHSPKLVGLGLVTAQTCQQCYCRDHPSPPSAIGLEPTTDHRQPMVNPPAPPRLLPCLHLGALAGMARATGRQGDPVHVCHHPRHGQTTLAGCRACPDYLYPLLTPQTPVAVVRQMIELPPRPQPEAWWTWPNVQQAHREAATEELGRAQPYPGGEGRGIVIVGGGRYFASAYVTVRVLRHVGCKLPIQLWHLSGEMTGAMAGLLEPYGVVCVDADQLTEDMPFRFLEGHWWKGWQLKAYALAHVRFREVLLLDADCYPVRDPAFLFDWPVYQERGAIFWPDCLGSAGLLRPQQWDVFGLAPGGLAFESGQLVIHRERCWAELRLALWYNAHADFVYRILWGDKDTFNMAWHRLGRAYAMPAQNCGWEMHTILQYDPEGAVLFQHRCRDKFRLEELTFDGTPQFGRSNLFNPCLAHERLCFSFLEELAQQVSQRSEE